VVQWASCDCFFLEPAAAAGHGANLQPNQARATTVPKQKKPFLPYPKPKGKKKPPSTKHNQNPRSTELAEEKTHSTTKTQVVKQQQQLLLQLLQYELPRTQASARRPSLLLLLVLSRSTNPLFQQRKEQSSKNPKFFFFFFGERREHVDRGSPSTRLNPEPMCTSVLCDVHEFPRLGRRGHSGTAPAPTSAPVGPSVHWMDGWSELFHLVSQPVLIILIP
jgi:hypothetical protein